MTNPSNKRIYSILSGFDLSLPPSSEILDPEALPCYHMPQSVLDNLSDALDIWARVEQYRLWDKENNPSPILAQNYSDAIFHADYITPCDGTQKDKQPIFSGLSPLLIAAGAFALGFAAGEKFGKLYQLSLLGTEAFGILDVLGTPLLAPSRMPIYLPEIPITDAFTLPRAGVFFPPQAMWTNGIVMTFHGLRRLFEYGEDTDRSFDVLAHGMYGDRSAIVNIDLPRYGSADVTVQFNFQFDQLLIPYQGSNGITLEFPLFANPEVYPVYNFGYTPFGFTGLTINNWGTPLNP